MGFFFFERCSSSDSGSKNDHEKQGPDRKESDWRKPNFDFWSQLQYGRNSALEAVGWVCLIVFRKKKCSKVV